MPIWLIIVLSIGIVAFSFVSLVGFIYWIAMLWNDYSIGVRIQKVLYLLVLGIINLMSFYILLKVTSHPG